MCRRCSWCPSGRTSFPPPPARGAGTPERSRQHRIVRRHADLRQERHAARGDIGGRRIEQSAMIGERDVVQIEMRVLRLERAPAAVGRLHADDPFACPRDRLGMRRIAVAMQQHADHRRVVDIRVVRIGVLERPPARPQPGPAHRPVADHVQDLPLAQPGARRRWCRRRPPPSRVPPARCPRPATGTAGNRRDRSPPPAACAPRARRSRRPDVRADSPACRTSSRCWRSPDRCRPAHRRRSAAR